MIVFNYYFKVLKEYKGMIILYTVLLIFFGAFSLQNSDMSTSFIANKPDVLIINYDTNSKIVNNLYQYIKDNATIKEIKDNENAINDALFYRDVNYIIYIPTDYEKDFFKGLNPPIEIKSTGDYQASYMSMLLERYLKVANLYQKDGYSEDEIIDKINTTLDNQVLVEVTSKLDTTDLANASFYYNFANYSLLAGSLYVIAIIMCSFKERNIRKRNIISSMKNSEYNKGLFLGNATYAFILWLLYILISFILVKDVMLTSYGWLFILNSFIFMITCLALAFLIGNLVSSKEAINGIVNVVALGSSFLCGAFVPREYLPIMVLNVSKILPSYWYIGNNELLKTLEVLNFSTLKPYIINCLVMIGFIVLLVVVTNILSRRLRKMG